MGIHAMLEHTVETYLAVPGRPSWRKNKEVCLCMHCADAELARLGLDGRAQLRPTGIPQWGRESAQARDTDRFLLLLSLCSCFFMHGSLARPAAQAASNLDGHPEGK